MDRNLNLRREKRKHRDSSQAGRAAGDQYGSRVALAGQLGAVGTKAIK